MPALKCISWVRVLGYQQIIFSLLPWCLNSSHWKTSKDTIQMKKSVSTFIFQPVLHQLSSRVQRFWKRIPYGLRNLQLSFSLSGCRAFPLIVLFINNIRFHKQSSVANMFGIPWWKDDMPNKVLQRTDERQNVPFFFLWIQPNMWEIWIHFVWNHRHVF